MTPAERIAADTWERIRLSKGLSVRLGEETLTDLLSLDFTRLTSDRRARLWQTTKAMESKQGTDLEIRIHAGRGRAILIAVQAKKLSSSGRYDSLGKKVKSSNSPQIDVLERYAKQAHAVPLYLLYNCVDETSAALRWHCCQILDPRQLGCTLVPSWHIRQAIRIRGCRSFDWIHCSCDALPWRCVFDCPKGGHGRWLDTVGRGLQETKEVEQRDHLGRYEWLAHPGPVEGGWPDWLWERDDRVLSEEDCRRLRGDYVAQAVAESGFAPRRLLLVDPDEKDEITDVGLDDAQRSPARNPRP